MALKRIKISSGSAWKATLGYSRAVRVGDQVFVGATVGRNRDGSVPMGPYVQARRALEIIGAA
jgi:enamine deaminase RidA (YjgF/YER057c/UK114 family)